MRKLDRRNKEAILDPPGASVLFVLFMPTRSAERGPS
jgi:hypothetical protein